jgi:prevent-host-death family protein
MIKQYSIAEARQNLAALVHEVERASAVELTRRGEPVAILLSIEEYRRLLSKESSFWEAYTRFRGAVDLTQLQIEPDTFDKVRDPSPGREVVW